MGSDSPWGRADWIHRLDSEGWVVTWCPDRRHCRSPVHPRRPITPSDRPVALDVTLPPLTCFPAE